MKDKIKWFLFEMEIDRRIPIIISWIIAILFYVFLIIGL